MKSSLTLVPSSDTAAQEEVTVLLEVDDKTKGVEDGAKPHLRLVGPDNQADFIKDALAAGRQKRKPRKRKSEAETDAKPSKVAAKTASEKKPKKPAPRKPRAKKPDAVTAGSTDVLQSVSQLSSEQRLAINAFAEILSQVAGQKAEELLSSMVSALGEDAPLNLQEAFEGPANPQIITDFETAVDAVMLSLAEPECEPELGTATEGAAKSEMIPLRVLGPMIVSIDNDPFELTEWTLFEENFSSRWYDSKAEAMQGLQAMMAESGLNYACETKLTSRYFNLSDYVYKRYSIGAVVGVYANYTECNDQDQCRNQDAKIENVILPEAQIAFDKAQAIHLADRKAQMKPESNLYDNSLKWFSIACGVALAIGVFKVAIETGFFG